MGNYLKSEIYKRSNNGKPVANYNDAKDGDISFLRSKLTQLLNNISPNVPTGLSNCTLTATQWVNPERPLMRAKTIINNPHKNEFYEVNEEDAAKGDLVIASDEDTRKDKSPSYHTMLINDFENGKPLVNYSNGMATKEGLRINKPLEWYTERSSGKTKNRFYRYLPKGTMDINLPEVVVTPNKTTISNEGIKKHINY